MINTTPKSRILVIIISILLVTNIILIAILVFKPVAKRGIRGDKFAMITAFLQNDMAFSKDQLHLYDSLNIQHRLKMKSLFDEIRKDKELQFKKLTAAAFNDTAISNTAELSSNKQSAVELAIFYHFKNIRDLCTPQQLPKFDSLFYKALNKRNEEIKK